MLDPVVSDLTRAIRNVCWLAAVCLMAAVSPVWASDAVVADFDGDGLRDWASVERHTPSVVHVWLSTTRAWSRLDAKGPVLTLAARDLDGDLRDEVVAGGPTDLEIWTRHPQGFKPLHPRPVAPIALPQPVDHAVDDDGDIAPAAVSPIGAWLMMPPRTTWPHSPSCVSSGHHCPDTAVDVVDSHVSPFAPRPPPLVR